VSRVIAVLPIGLIVIDDIGMLPAGNEAAEAFYRVVDAAYERRSVAVTSNLPPLCFDTIMPKTLATATVDALAAPRPRGAHRWSQLTASPRRPPARG